MPRSEFIHLHLHTQYSLLDGACRIPDILALAGLYKMVDSLAITDHGSMFGGSGILHVCPESRNQTDRGVRSLRCP